MSKNKGYRTCLVSNKKSDSSDFFRFTIQNGVLIFDGRKKNKGRGGYVKKTKENLEKLKKNPGKICYFLKVKKCEISDTVIKEQISKIS